LDGTGYSAVDLDALIGSLTGLVDEYEATNKEIDPDTLLSDDAVACPRCGFEFEQ
jgi:hypothetical protein